MTFTTARRDSIRVSLGMLTGNCQRGTRDCYSVRWRSWRRYRTSATTWRCRFWHIWGRGWKNMLINGNALHIPLADKSVQCCITSPPYWGLRDYGTATWGDGDAECEHSPADTPQKRGIASSTLDGGKSTTGHQQEGYADVCGKCGARRIDAQLGLEASPEEYIANLVAVFREVWRVLRDDGVVWLNLGDSYAQASSRAAQSNDSHEYKHTNKRFRSGRYSGGANIKAPRGLKPKDLCMIPARVALALQADGWWIRSAPPWLKKNPMPESCTDRPTTAHETIFLLTKSERYYYDSNAVRGEPAPQSIARIQQPNFHNQTGGPKDYKHGTNPNRSMRKTLENFADNPGRNRRTTDWWYESLDIAINETAAQLAHLCDVRDNGGMLCDEEGMPLGFMVNTHGFPGAHFATFPPKLVEPMILAGTSERGACPECGAGWTRVVDKGEVQEHPARLNRANDAKQFHMDDGDYGNGGSLGRMRTNTTTGWRPVCGCYDDDYRAVFHQVKNPRKRHQRDVSGNWFERVRKRPGSYFWDTIPCVVLDPFAGSGTVNLVSEQLGRWVVGLDLSMEYLQLARERTGAKALAEWEHGIPAGDADLTGLPMFEEAG